MNIKQKPQYRSNKTFMGINHGTQTQQTRQCNNNFQNVFSTILVRILVMKLLMPQKEGEVALNLELHRLQCSLGDFDSKSCFVSLQSSLNK